jgi:hypothetical protein
VTGVLTVSDQFAGSHIQDETGNCCFDKTVHGAGLFKIGDSVTVTGTRSTLQVKFKLVP